MMQKSTLALAGAIAVTAAASATADTEWPTQQVTLVTHSSAGGGGDVMMRNLGRTLETEFGVATTVDNRVGGSGAVAMTWIATQAPSDGYTLLSVTPTQLITPLRAPGVPTYEDMTPIARLFLDPTTLYVHRDSPFQTAEEFIEHARENPRQLTIGFGSAGSLEQLVVQDFEAAAEIDVRLVPHEGGGDAVVALLGQHIDAVAGEPGQGLTHLQDGTLRLLGVFQEDRLDDYPDVPTFAELGYPVISNKFRGVFGPPDMDEDTVNAIATTLEGIYEAEPWRTYWQEGSISPAFLGPDEFRTYLDQVNEEFRDFVSGLN